MSEKHTWSDDDNLITYYLYRYGDRKLPNTKPEIAEAMGISMGSLSYKIGNFRAIDGQGNLDGYSRQAVRIYNQYYKLTADETMVATVSALQRVYTAHIGRLQAEQARRRT